MNDNRTREFQTIRLFATLGLLTLLVVLMLRVVLFAPHDEDKGRSPAQIVLPMDNQNLFKQPSN